MNKLIIKYGVAPPKENLLDTMEVSTLVPMLNRKTKNQLIALGVSTLMLSENDYLENQRESNRYYGGVYTDAKPKTINERKKEYPLITMRVSTRMLSKNNWQEKQRQSINTISF